MKTNYVASLNDAKGIKIDNNQQKQSKIYANVREMLCFCVLFKYAHAFGINSHSASTEQQRGSNTCVY